MTEPLHWLKERILEYEDRIAPDTRGIVHIHCRLRSDGSMWYAVDTPALHTPSNPLPARIESRFENYLTRVVPFSVRPGWTEADFDADFLERLQKTHGKEITNIVQ